MNLNPLYALIRRFEGLRLKVYKCPAGVWTIGYGSTGKDITAKTKPVSADWADERMKNDAQKFILASLKLSPILADKDNQLCAIADFSYNLGSTAYKASTLRKRVNAGQWKAAARELNKWVYGGGKKLPGLVLRRTAEGLLINKFKS